MAARRLVGRHQGEPAVAHGRDTPHARLSVSPSQIGIGRCRGSGQMPISSRRCQRPWNVTASWVKSARNTVICSSRRAPRVR